MDGDTVICIVGGEPGAKVMAFDKRTGTEIWRALSSDWEMGYAQPIILEAGGARQLIIWHPQAVTALNQETGETYWEEPWDAPSALTIATPVRSGPYLFFTQFWAGSMMMRFNEDRASASVVWKRGGKSPFPDETDELKLSRRGDRLQFFVNGARQGEIPLTGPIGPSVGFVVRNEIEVLFDDLVVTTY